MRWFTQQEVCLIQTLTSIEILQGIGLSLVFQTARLELYEVYSTLLIQQNENRRNCQPVRT